MCCRSNSRRVVHDKRTLDVREPHHFNAALIRNRGAKDLIVKRKAKFGREREYVVGQETFRERVLLATPRSAKIVLFGVV